MVDFTKQKPSTPIDSLDRVAPNTANTGGVFTGSLERSSPFPLVFHGFPMVFPWFSHGKNHEPWVASAYDGGSWNAALAQLQDEAGHLVGD